MLDKVTQRFSDYYRLENGNRVLGKISDITFENPSATNFEHERRTFVTGPKAPLSAGDIIRDPMGTRFIVGLHGNISNHTNTVWRLIQVTGKYTHQRMGSSNDPVTGLPKSTSLTSLDDVYGSLEEMPFLKDELRIEQQRFRLVTGTEIKEGDRVNGLKVADVMSFLGVYISEVSE